MREAVRMHILGEFPYQSRTELVKALEAADPKEGAEWNRTRLDYQLTKVKREMMAGAPSRARGAEISPSDANLTEGFGVGEADGSTGLMGLDLTLLGEASPTTETAAPNPLGGRPEGTTKEASRRAKKAKEALLDSASKAYAKKKEEYAADKEAGRPISSTGAMKAIIAEKVEKYSLAYKMPMEPPSTKTIYTRVRRHEGQGRPLRGLRRGPDPLLVEVEPLLLSFVEEAAEVGIYFNSKQLAAKMADLISETPIGDAYATFAAKVRCQCLLLGFSHMPLISPPPHPHARPAASTTRRGTSCTRRPTSSLGRLGLGHSLRVTPSASRRRCPPPWTQRARSGRPWTTSRGGTCHMCECGGGMGIVVRALKCAVCLCVCVKGRRGSKEDH